MTTHTTALRTTDRSAFAPLIGTALSMMGMIALVAVSAVHMMG